METFQIQNNDSESMKANWSQIDKLSDRQLASKDSLLWANFNSLKEKQNEAHQLDEERCQGDDDSSISLLNQLFNPFASFREYLSDNGYISDLNKLDPNTMNAKLLTLAEEFSQNFYYAFIAKAILSYGKVIFNHQNKLLLTTRRLLSTKNLMMCAFLSVLGGSYKFAMEKLKTLSNKHDKINTLISIGLAAFSLLQNKSKMKKNYMFLFLFWKYIEMMSKILEKGKVIKKVKKLEIEFYELAILNLSFRFSFRVNVSRKDKEES